MLDQRLHAAKAGRAREQLRACGNGKRLVTPAAHAERQHRSEAAHLLARDVVSRVRFEAWIEHAFDAAMAMQELHEPRRSLRLCAHATRERRQAAANEPAI